MAGAGDCTKTSAWGSHWDWSKDWSIDWGKDFDKEWKQNKNDASTMKDRVDDLEDNIRKASNCTTTSEQQAANQVSDGSAVTVNGTSSNCTFVGGASGTEAGASSAGTAASSGRKLAARSESSLQLSTALLAARSAAQCSPAATQWMMQQPLGDAWHDDDDDADKVAAWLSATSDMTAAAASEAESRVRSDQDNGGKDGEGSADAFAAEFADELLAGGARHLTQVTLPGFINFDVGCWYCYYGRGA